MNKLRQNIGKDIAKDIAKELDYATNKWGIEFDDKNTINDWSAYITKYLGQAVNMGISKDEQRRQLVKVAGLAVSALESFDRNNGFPPRHYDKDSIIKAIGTAGNS